MVKKFLQVLCILAIGMFIMGMGSGSGNDPGNETPPVVDNEFSVIIASDPQLWWNSIDDVSGFSDSEVEAYNKRHRNAMKALVAGNGLPSGFSSPVALIMNGDLTEYGRWDQWEAYYDIYDSTGVPIYDGMGNHDYANNSPSAGGTGCRPQADDVAEFTAKCAAFDWFGEGQVWGDDACTVIYNMTAEGTDWCASDSVRRMLYWLETNGGMIVSYDPGSAAYSFDIGGVHFIQLHNYPTYSVPEIGISDSIDWLKSDLGDAVYRNKWIVINMHDMVNHFKGYENTEFLDALDGSENNILGIFAGHYHRYAGYAKDISSSYRDVVVNGRSIPWFYSGSSTYNAFNLVSFNSSGMTVQPIDSNSGSPVHYSGKTYVPSDVGGTSAILTAPKTVPYP